MGVRRKYVRLLPNEFTRLLASTDSSALDDVIADIEPYFFWPLDDGTTTDARKLCIEKGYWEWLESILRYRLVEDSTPTWDFNTDGRVIPDVWFGYGPLRYLRPDEVVHLHEVLTAIAATSFDARFAADYRESDMTADKFEDWQIGMRECLQALGLFVATAVHERNALAWYIS